MALADGESRIKVGELTEHTKAGLYIISKFLPESRIEIEKLHSTNIIKIKGRILFKKKIKAFFFLKLGISFKC